ncbi:MAG TPA: hypothetical protein VNT22_01360 [Baekduia sp.]|nr:hypothetical protein [Baekduia sp.]
MSKNDDRIPEDLADIAGRLSAGKATIEPSRRNELRERVRMAAIGSARSRRRLIAGPMNFAVAALAAGAILTSSAGVVMATSGLGGSSHNNSWWGWPWHGHKDASSCQYKGPFTRTYTYRYKQLVITVTVTWNCKHLKYSFSSNLPFSYQYGNGPTHGFKSGSHQSTAPSGTSGVTIIFGGKKYTLPL